jgi:3-methyladenine DNA glycosylase/8-oxoguanine DNA glycosylase
VNRFSVLSPPDFDFRATVQSHGWCQLAPFVVVEGGSALEWPTRITKKRLARIGVSQPGGRGSPVEVDLGGTRAGVSKPGRATIEASVRRVLRLDEDLSEFHALCRAAGPPFDRAATGAFGRLLRSPTLFEDMVKVLATTNTAWSGTRAMVARLIAITDGAAFPTPAEVAALGAERIRSEGRWGYRAGYLAALAKRVDSGDLDLAVWEQWPSSTEELAREIHDLPGFGPYAVSQVLALLGRYDRIGVDSVFRSFVLRRHFPRARKVPSTRRMLAVYDDWGSWRFLAYWWEVWLEYQSTIARTSSGSRPAKK